MKICPCAHHCLVAGARYRSKNSMVLDPFASRLAIGDEEWREKIRVLDELQSFVGIHASSLTSEHLNALVVPFRTMLRSSVVKKACDVFSELAQLLRQKVKPLVDKVFQAMMEARGGSNKIRDSCLQYLWIVLTNWSPTVLEAVKPRIQDSLSDASPLCREVGRQCYGQFIALWPAKKLELQAKLSPTAMKYLAALNFADKVVPECESKDYMGRAIENPPHEDDDTKHLSSQIATLEAALQLSKQVVAQLKAENESLRIEHRQSHVRMRSLQTQTTMLETLVKDADLDQQRQQVDATAAIQSKNDENRRLQGLLTSALNQVDRLSSSQWKPSACPCRRHRFLRTRAYSLDAAVGETCEEAKSKQSTDTTRLFCQAKSQTSNPDDQTERLQNDLANMTAMVESVQVEKAQLNDQVDSLGKQLEHLQKTLHDVQVDGAFEQTKHLNMEAEFVDKIHDLEQQLEAATAENEVMTEQLATSASTCAALKAEMDVVKSQLSKVTADCTDLESDRQAVLVEIDRVRTELTSKLARKEVTLDRLKTENTMVQMKVEALMKTNEELHSIVKITEDAYYQIREDVSSQSLEEVECMAGVKAENDSLQARVQGLLKQLDAAESTNGQLRDLVTEAEADKEELKDNLQATVSQLEACQYRAEMADDAVGKVRRELSSQLQAKDEELMNLTFDNQALRSQVESLGQRVDELQSCIKFTEDAYYQMREDVSSQALDDVASVAPVKAENESLQTRVHDLLEQRDELDHVNQQLRHDVESLKSTLNQLHERETGMSQHLRDVEAQLQTTTEENCQLRSDLCSQSLLDAEAAEKSQHETQVLQIQVQSLHKQLVGLEAVLAVGREAYRKLQSDLDVQSHVKRDNDRLRVEIAALTDQLDALQAAEQAASSSKEELMVLSAKAAEAHAELKRVQSQASTYQHSIRDLEARLQSLQQDNAQLHAALATQSTKQADARAKLKFENQCLQSRVDSLQRQLLDTSRGICDMDISMQDEVCIELTQRELESPSNPSKPTTTISPEEHKASNKQPAPLGAASRW
ncbi:hypothetical protein DYB26_003696, partial [Aphanomyces astaci]